MRPEKPGPYVLQLSGPNRIIPKSEPAERLFATSTGKSYEQYPIDTARFKRVVESRRRKIWLGKNQTAMAPGRGIVAFTGAF